ncbi:MAG: flagellar basal body protein FliL [Alphaproteobacteria bacterium]|nr:flagellar basal body protein FliL [Alphaproteobacteria bacterium]
MAERDENEEATASEEEGAGGGEEQEASSAGRKRLLIIIILAVLLVVGGIAGAYFMGYLNPLIEKLTGKGTEAVASQQSRESVFMDLPELLVNLNTGGRRTSFIKMKVTLEVDRKEFVPVIEKLMPRIIDNFQVYLRELKLEDLRGSVGMYRLREEMLLRVNTAAAPAQVNDVLFKEILIQ